MKTSFVALRHVAVFVAAFGLLLSGSGCVNNGNSYNIPNHTAALPELLENQTENAVKKHEVTEPHQLPDGSLQLGPDKKPIMVTRSVTDTESPAQQLKDAVKQASDNITRQNAAIQAAKQPGVVVGSSPTYVPVGLSGAVIDQQQVVGSATTARPYNNAEEYVEYLRFPGRRRGG